MTYHIQPGMTDSHLHILEMLEKEMPAEQIIRDLQKNGMPLLLDAGVTTEDFDRRLSYRQYHDGLYFSAGIHPNVPRDEWPAGHEAILRDQAAHPLVKALGETGLDFFRTHSPREDQALLLDLHYNISLTTGKPLIFHCREADRELTEWITARDFPHGGVLHCFAGNPALGEAALSKGLYISFAGNATFKSAQIIRDALHTVPLDRLLVETDAPYLAPVPKRGRLNHSGYIGYIYEMIADELSLELQDLTNQVEINLKSFLDL